MNQKRIRKRNRKNIENLRLILTKSFTKIKRIVVSQDFMKSLGNEADLIDIRSEKVSDTKHHDFEEVHATYSEENEIWYLWEIPLMYSNALQSGAIIELRDDNTVVIEGISEYKNK